MINTTPSHPNKRQFSSYLNPESNVQLIFINTYLPISDIAIFNLRMLIVLNCIIFITAGYIAGIFNQLVRQIESFGLLIYLTARLVCQSHMINYTYCRSITHDQLHIINYTCSSKPPFIVLRLMTS